MYSGTTLTKYSGRLIGAHQKIDSISRRHLAKVIPDNTVFPKIRQILAFEGKNGPDGIKRKSPGEDEPWHFFDPFDDDDSELIGLITGHFNELVAQLKANNGERTAFEAAWLAHALVDGLTPAHHYPYDSAMSELRGGDGKETRTTIKQKIVMPGDTKREQIKNNWKMYGPKGLFSTHGLFELGVSSILKPLALGEAVPTERDMRMVNKIGVIDMFRHSAREIAVLDMYDNYYKKGWTPTLAWQVRHKLGPTIVQTVTLSWYQALVEAELVKKVETSASKNS